MTFTLRPAVRADVRDIWRLVRGLAEYERASHEFTATEGDFDRLIFGAAPLSEAIMAEIPNRPPVGVALFHMTVNTFKGRTGLFLEDLFVEPDLRGAGIGKALLREVARVAVERNCNNVEWRVLNWNEPSIAFYEHLGAKHITQWQTRRLFGDALSALARSKS